ncbi:MAG: hypothetical protein NT051_06295 [Candidatus Micrarchaeota archaeon]|nr:hypothetical protein [Candidatus Micrarchaeota archaeon]
MASKLLYAACAAAFLLLLACAFLTFQFFSLSSQVSSLTSQNEAARAKIAETNANFSSFRQTSSVKEAGMLSAINTANSKISSQESSIASLNSQLLQKENELNRSKLDLNAQKERISSLALELGALESTINESIAWFKDNARLPTNYSWNGDIFQKRVISDCVDGGNLNLACISYLMENTAFSIHYRTDSVSGKTDHLQGVKETIDLGWGDCEDYSLIFKATLNSIAQKQANLAPVAFTSGTGNFRVYPKESLASTGTESYWYVPQAKGISLGNLSKLHTYVVCYTYSSSGGHCTVAMGEGNITSSSETGALMGARVFEPQSGQYLGAVGSEFGICASDDCYSTVRSIRLIITDSDLYVFQQGTGWTGYGDYAEKVHNAYAWAGAGEWQ